MMTKVICVLLVLSVACFCCWDIKRLEKKRKEIESEANEVMSRINKLLVDFKKR